MRPGPGDTSRQNRNPPETWTAEFKDFLATCLKKDPAERPTAQELLASSPFVLQAGGKSIIAELVEESMAEIEQYVY